MTIEELRAYDKEIQSLDHEEYRKLWEQALARYVDESGDELLKTAYYMGNKIPWGKPKIVEYTIGSSKLIWNHETKTLEGPKRIVNKIKKQNEILAGERDPAHNSGSYEDQFLYVPPGNLWNPSAFAQLVFRIFGRDVGYKEIEHYPSDPMLKFFEEYEGRPIIINY